MKPQSNKEIKEKVLKKFFKMQKNKTHEQIITEKKPEELVDLAIQETIKQFEQKIKERIEELEKFKLDPYHGGYTDKFVDCKIAELQKLMENEKE